MFVHLFKLTIPSGNYYVLIIGYSIKGLAEWVEGLSSILAGRGIRTSSSQMNKLNIDTDYSLKLGTNVLHGNQKWKLSK